MALVCFMMKRSFYVSFMLFSVDKEQHLTVFEANARGEYNDVKTSMIYIDIYTFFL